MSRNVDLCSIFVVVVAVAGFCCCFSSFFRLLSCLFLSCSAFITSCSCSLLRTSSSVNMVANRVEMAGGLRLEGAGLVRGAGGAKTDDTISIRGCEADIEKEDGEEA